MQVKELSTEEKAKRYDEVIERLRNAFYDNSGRMCEEYRKAVIRIIEPILPELAESEDERIRKELIRETKGSEIKLFEAVTNEEFVDWLEKRGEPLDKIAQRARTEKQRVLITESDNVVNIDWDTDSLLEASFLMTYGLYYIRKIGMDVLHTQASDRYKAFSTSCRLGDKEYKELNDFLELFKPRSSWKPSSEQMKYLWKYAEQNNYDGSILTSLYNDLKKLKGM